MSEIEIILGLLLVMAGLLALANRLRVPYPILLVIGGLVIAFVTNLFGVHPIELEPEIIFVVFLPPIVQSAAFFTPIRDFKSNISSIGLLAVGLVLFTTAVVAVVAHALIPELSWAAAFVLGAIVAPPDAVAATSIASRLHLPRRIVTILEGESLVNDATAIVAYRVALAAVISGTFSFLDAGIQFVIAAVGGVVIGLAFGWIGMRIIGALRDSSVVLILSFLVGYGTYIVAERVHASGVLAVVAMGIYFGRAWNRGGEKFMTAETRLQTEAVWRGVISLFNSILFILIGLQLPVVLRNLRVEASPLTLTFYAVAVCLAVILARIVWMPFGSWLARLTKSSREGNPYPSFASIFIVSWTGMRGVVSLAIALSIPETIAGGGEFPGRSLIIFLTFCVILATLVLQGLSLPFIIRMLGVRDDGASEREQAKARWVAAKAGRQHLDGLAKEQTIAAHLLQDLMHHYEMRTRRFEARYQGLDNEAEDFATAYAHIQQELLDVEYTAVVELRDKGVINDEVLFSVQREINLERVRLNNDHDEEDHAARDTRNAARQSEAETVTTA